MVYLGISKSVYIVKVLWLKVKVTNIKTWYTKFFFMKTDKTWRTKDSSMKFLLLKALKVHSFWRSSHQISRSQGLVHKNTWKNENTQRNEASEMKRLSIGLLCSLQNCILFQGHWLSGQGPRHQKHEDLWKWIPIERIKVGRWSFCILVS